MAEITSVLAEFSGDLERHIHHVRRSVAPRVSERAEIFDFASGGRNRAAFRRGAIIDVFRSCTLSHIRQSASH